jgi:O-antigen/teichoic acid export membrane protein
MTKVHQPAYRNIMKVTAIFGGVQVFNVIIQIIRSKFIAVLLGPSGLGIMGMLTGTIGIIGGLTNFGIGVSAVKDIAVANSSANEEKISIILTIFRRLVIITGVLGTLLVLLLSPWLSMLTFGSGKYTGAFCWISVTLLLSQLSSGQMAVLQGMKKIKSVAKADLLGSLAVLLVTFPLYYLYGVNGIVPGIIVTAACTFLISNIFFRQISVKSLTVSPQQTIDEGKNMLKMGFMISMSGLLALGASYAVRLFISRNGGVDQVGLYSAGFSIVNSYVGLIFAGMGADYYPRLSAVAFDNNLLKQIINQQTEIVILILGPILVIFMTFINFVIILLYSQKFVSVKGMICWAAIGVIFKAISWSVAFIFLAKGGSKVFFLNELIGNVYMLAFNLIGYYFMDLTGLGISFTISYFIYMCQVYLMAKYKYKFEFENKFIFIFLIQIFIVIISFVNSYYLSNSYAYATGLFLLLLSGMYSFVEIHKRINIRDVVGTIVGKINGYSK